MNRLLKRIRKMRDDELVELSREVDREIQIRLVQSEDEPSTVQFSGYRQPVGRAMSTPRPAYERRRAA
jgi:membrane-bound lytic murein transglycosylase